MPYKDKKKQAEAQRRHYQKNKAYYVDKKNKRREETKAFIKDYKANLKCDKCSENHISCLDFHHNNPEEKEVCIAEMYRKGWGKKRILKEIEKCIVLCSNCHRKLHHAEKEIIAE